MVGLTMPIKQTLLLLTDFSYQAKGREYFREDVELSCYLRKYFKVCICHIDDMENVMDHVDVVLIRNTGPQIFHHKQLTALRMRKNLVLFNDLAGKGDIKGKNHLLELYHGGYPVIPTFHSQQELQKWGTCERYLLKPLDGADSWGVKILNHDELQLERPLRGVIQPLVEFKYEVSLYFIGDEFYYALYAPNPQKRWELRPYKATKEDEEFALKFIRWNSCKLGIQRVDACRLSDGRLLLMELEDYNPFLSLELLKDKEKERFLEALCFSLKQYI